MRDGCWNVLEIVLVPLKTLQYNLFSKTRHDDQAVEVGEVQDMNWPQLQHLQVIESGMTQHQPMSACLLKRTYLVLASFWSPHGAPI